MGFIRKLNGVDKEIESTNRNAAAQEDATRQAAALQQQELINTAKAAADQQAMIAARNQAESNAADLASQPVENAEVNIQTTANSGVEVRKKRRQQFGTDYNSGVQV